MTEPARLGRFDTKKLLGRGAMGAVYLAEDSDLGRSVALKIFEAHPTIAPEELDDLKRRFAAEARAAGSISHPNVVKIFEAGEEGTQLYIAMEYVPGQTLEDVLATGEIPGPEEICSTAAALAEALDAAHAAGVVHRDIKPANILVDASGAPKIADFGVAHQAASTLTRTGTMIGTPAYMSPEQIRGKPVSGAADQFALAILTFRMLTGRLPFDAPDPVRVMRQITTAEPALASALNVRLPKALDGVFARALAKDAAARYPTCGEFVTSLREALEGRVEPPAAAATDGLDPEATVRVSASALTMVGPPGERPTERSSSWPARARRLLRGHRRD